MINEVKIVLESEIHKNANGTVLEQLVRHLLERQEYQVDPNLHFTGLEIDLLARHKYKNETLYVECKAKEKPKSAEIKSFIFGVDYGYDGTPVDYGYFIHTEELDRQAGALKAKFESDKKNVSFIGPEKIINLLVSSGRISKLNFEDIETEISKLILAYTYFGIFYILLFQENAIAQNFAVIDAKTTASAKDDQIARITESIKEVKDMNFVQLPSTGAPQSSKCKSQKTLDTVTEIKESENWYDYSPASIKHFIGRSSLRTSLLNFIESVRTGKTQNRIFYLDGKSGWGKSSVIAELRGRTRTKFWKKRVFTFAVDTRSASTNNFIALAVKKMIEDAEAKEFLPPKFCTSKLKITSPYEILSDQSITRILTYLKSHNKILLIVFDQFEDVFRKEDLFEAFHKFLIDVNDAKDNILVGFSWKSEINIPLGNAAYHKFSQIKDYALSLKIPEFGLTDVKNVIKQLRREINQSINNDLERRLIDASQGFPWLIKKLCIHTYQQYNEGRTIEELIEQDLNIKSLFDSDLEKLTIEEASTLKYIANRSYKEFALDISELENIDQEALHQLIHKRLVINTGSKYNIYWDIFRDYLVSGDIPVIGESYLIRQSVSVCLPLFLSFANKATRTFDEISIEYSKSLTPKSLFNILFELRSIGLLKKKDYSDIYELTDPERSVNKNAFVEYISAKLSNYTPYIELTKLDKKKITVDDIVGVLKNIFKASDFREKTWKAYAQNLITWFNYTSLPIKDKIVESKKGRISSFEFSPDLVLYVTPQSIIDAVEKVISGESITKRVQKELKLHNIISILNDDKYVLNENVNFYKTADLFHNHLADSALRFNKISPVYQFLRTNPTAKSTDILSYLPELTNEFNTELSKKQINYVFYSWALFILNVKDKEGKGVKSKRSGNRNYLCYTPEQLSECYRRFVTNSILPTSEEKKKIQFLQQHGLGLDPQSPNFELKDIFDSILRSTPDLAAIAEFLRSTPKPKLHTVLQNFPNTFKNYTTQLSKINRWHKVSNWAKLLNIDKTVEGRLF